MNREQQKPLTAEEIFKKFDINPSYQSWRHLVVKAVNHYVDQQTAQLRQELKQKQTLLDAGVSVSADMLTELERVKAQRDEAVKLIRFCLYWIRPTSVDKQIADVGIEEMKVFLSSLKK